MPEMDFDFMLSQARTKYANLWQHDWEQSQSRILSYVTQMPDVLSRGKYYEFPTIGGTNVREYTGVNVDVEFDSLRSGKRGMKYRKFYNAIPLSEDAIRDMGTLDMNFAMVQAKQRAAAERFFDMCALGVKMDESGKYVLKTSDDEGYAGGILSTGYGGENGEQEYELDLSLEGWQAGTGNLIPIDFATGGTGVSGNYAGTIVDRMGAAVTRLLELNASDGTPEDLVLCISPKVHQLIRSLELSLNRDYGMGGLRPGVAQYVTQMHATVLISNMLPTMTTETIKGETVEGARMCCAWLKSQIGFGAHESQYRLKDVNNKVDIDAYSRVKGRAACARMRDDAVFVLPVDESPAA